MKNIYAKSKLKQHLMMIPSKYNINETHITNMKQHLLIITSKQNSWNSYKQISLCLYTVSTTVEVISLR